jgi:hypothetical protein
MRPDRIRKALLVAASAAFLALPSAAPAQQPGELGSAEDAKAMLLRVMAALKEDRGRALDVINRGLGGFLDRDLYPFCFNVRDGKAVAAASPNSKQAIGRDVRTLKDAAGKSYGLEFYAAAQKPEGEITEVTYMFPTPGDPKPVPKVSYITRAGDLACGVGYYKELAPATPVSSGPPQPSATQAEPARPSEPRPPHDGGDGL